jgi:hypothetical protein
MGYYNNIIGQGLANKLAAAGMELRPLPPTFDYELNYEAPTYAVVFDWFLKNGLFIEVAKWIQNYWAARVAVISDSRLDESVGLNFETWRYAANAAIEKAIEILKSLKK